MEASVILKEIHEMSGNVNNFMVNFARRDANELAHLCAKQGNSYRRRCLWISYILRF